MANFNASWICQLNCYTSPPGLFQQHTVFVDCRLKIWSSAVRVQKRTRPELKSILIDCTAGQVEQTVCLFSDHSWNADSRVPLMMVDFEQNHVHGKCSLFEKSFVNLLKIYLKVASMCACNKPYLMISTYNRCVVNLCHVFLSWLFCFVTSIFFFLLKIFSSTLDNISNHICCDCYREEIYIHTHAPLERRTFDLSC